MATQDDAPFSYGGQRESAAFKKPSEKNRQKIQAEIAALRAEMGLPPNASADARLAKAEPSDFPASVFTPRIV